MRFCNITIGITAANVPLQNVRIIYVATGCNLHAIGPVHTFFFIQGFQNLSGSGVHNMNRATQNRGNVKTVILVKKNAVCAPTYPFC